MISAIPADGWASATPCSDWTVRDLVRHVIAGNVKYAEIALGADFVPGAPDVVFEDDLAGMYRRTLTEMLVAWRRPGALDRAAGLPQGRGRAETAAWIHLAETLTCPVSRI